MQSTARPRMVVLGLDGLSYSLARDLCPKLAHLSHLALSEKCYPISAEIPELSPVNWTSFFTASGPEKHGIYGFTSLDPGDYTLSCADFTQVAEQTIFDRLGERNLISKVINLPNTYPARPIKGMLISGFVARDLKRAVHPPFLASRLHAQGYKLEADTSYGAQDPDFLLSELQDTLRSRRMALDLLWPDLAWDLFVMVLTETDRLAHFLLPAVNNEEDPLHGPCLDFLKNWDKLIGEILERYQALPQPKRLIVLADHGFTELKTEVDLNVWLQKNSFLKLGQPPSSQWDAGCIDPQTKAFALDPGRIYMHTKSRYSRGRLSQSEALKLREEILSGLINLTYAQQEPVFQDIFRSEDLYPSGAEGQRPDLICVPQKGYDLKAKFDRNQVFGFYGRKGTHTPDDVFFFDSQESQVTKVRQVGQQVLSYFQKPHIISAKP